MKNILVIFLVFLFCSFELIPSTDYPLSASPLDEYLVICSDGKNSFYQMARYLSDGYECYWEIQGIPEKEHCGKVVYWFHLPKIK